MTAQVLLVDDDQELLELLRDYLEQDGFSITCVHDGLSGVNAALSGQYAIVVLDVMMPGVSGIDALGMIRARSNVPVIMLTARGDDLDRIVGLEMGADDYVPKPCTPRELAARFRAILKRSHPVTALSEQIVAGALSLWPAKRFAEYHGTTLDLTGTEFSLLELLVRHAGQVVSKKALAEHALGRPLTRFDRSIDVHLSSIRRKLGVLPDGRSPILTVVRQGYQWLAN